MPTFARQSKTESLTFRVSPRDKELLEDAAARSGSDVTTYVLAPALYRARDSAERETATVLAGEARERFIHIVEHAPAPTARLIRSLSDKRHQLVD